MKASQSIQQYELQNVAGPGSSRSSPSLVNSTQKILDDFAARASPARSKPSRPIQDPVLSRSTAARSRNRDISEGLPARKVFLAGALPLDLPELDRLLSNPVRFRRPQFESLGRLSEREDVLFRKEPSAALHINAHQLSVPPDANDEAPSSQLKKRRRWWSRDSVRVLDNSSASTSCQDLQQSYMPDPTAPKTPEDQIIPPLMLLTAPTSLDELKSNAIGPRAPPGGLLGSLPTMQWFLSFVLNYIIGAAGSSGGLQVFRLTMLFDFAQVLQLNLDSSLSNPHSTSKLRRFLLHSLPALLALDFVSVFGLAIGFFFLWMALTAYALFWFCKISYSYDPNRNIEGFEGQPYLFRSPMRNTKVASILVAFVLMLLYIPLSALSLRAVIWSSDFWVSSDPAVLAAEARGVCYTTTLDADGFNWAPIVVFLAVLSLLVYTLLWPAVVARIVMAMAPKVSKYDSFGVRRSPAEMEKAYEQLLDKDKSPLTFLYNAFNRSHSWYRPFHLLCFKLGVLVPIVVINTENCLFRRYDVATVNLIQQCITLGLQLSFLILHWWTKPYVDRVSNRTETLNRFCYLIVACGGLYLAIYTRGSGTVNSVMFGLVILSYIAAIYFSLITTQVGGRWLKRFQRRLDFSLDLYSATFDPRQHVKRRIIQETLSTIMLAGPEYRMPIDSINTFSLGGYLLFFRGTLAERHVENLKIITAIGMEEYRYHVRRLQSKDEGPHLRRLINVIRIHFAGPDAYFRPPRPSSHGNEMASCWFGKAFLKPFPPTLIMRYDSSDGLHEFTSCKDLELFIEQNSSDSIREARMVRLCLRALDGERVFCPFTAEWETSSRSRFWKTACTSRDSKTFAMPRHYTSGILNVKVKDFAKWEDYNYSAGFEVTVQYHQDLKVEASRAIGLSHCYFLSSSVASFFRANEDLLLLRVPEMRERLKRYRVHYANEAQWKEKVLSYEFATDVFDDIEDDDFCSQQALLAAFRRHSSAKHVQELPLRYPGSTQSLYERFHWVTSSKIHEFWFVFWSDLWRSNAADWPILSSNDNAPFFDERYASSIAYRPLPQEELVQALRDRGLWIQEGQRGPIHGGTLNRLYLALYRLMLDEKSNSGPQIAWWEHRTAYGSSPASWRIKAWDGLMEYLCLHPFQSDRDLQDLRILVTEGSDGKLTLIERQV